MFQYILLHSYTPAYLQVMISVQEKFDSFVLLHLSCSSSNVFSSPEHKVLRVRYCDTVLYVIRRQHLACEHATGHIFCPIFIKLGQNVGLYEISDKFVIGSCGVKK